MIHEMLLSLNLEWPHKDLCVTWTSLPENILDTSNQQQNPWDNIDVLMCGEAPDPPQPPRDNNDSKILDYRAAVNNQEETDQPDDLLGNNQQNNSRTGGGCGPSGNQPENPAITVINVTKDSNKGSKSITQKVGTDGNKFSCHSRIMQSRLSSHGKPSFLH